jgi:DNA-binding CsgD family transcriptional regulator
VPTAHRLSKREIDALRLLVEGESDREIAAELFTSRHMVHKDTSSAADRWRRSVPVTVLSSAAPHN